MPLSDVDISGSTITFTNPMILPTDVSSAAALTDVLYTVRITRIRENDFQIFLHFANSTARLPGELTRELQRIFAPSIVRTSDLADLEFHGQISDTVLALSMTVGLDTDQIFNLPPRVATSRRPRSPAVVLDRQDAMRSGEVGTDADAARLINELEMLAGGVALDPEAASLAPRAPVDWDTVPTGGTQPAHETVMEPPSPVQLQIMQQLQQRYKTEMDALGGVDQAIADLKKHLVDTYNSKPLEYSHGGKLYKIPLTWEALQKFFEDNAFDEQQQNEIKKLQYADPVHSAYRYFLKPNPWIKANALHALRIEYRDPNSGSYANFSEYKEHIAYLWLAVRDAKEPGDLAARQLFFFGHLRLANRGHNLDERITTLEDGRHVILRDKDDQLGDDPTCTRGVYNTLYGGLSEHSVLQQDAKAIAHVYISAFYQEYYKQIFDNMNLDHLEGLKECCSDAEGKDTLLAAITAINANPGYDFTTRFVARTKYQLERAMYSKDVTALIQDQITAVISKVTSVSDPVQNFAELHFVKNYIFYGLGAVLDAAIADAARDPRRSPPLGTRSVSPYSTASSGSAAQSHNRFLR